VFVALTPEIQKTSRELFRELKQEGVLVVPGEPFFFGLDQISQQWAHQHQCLQINFNMEPEIVEKALHYCYENNVNNTATIYKSMT